MCVCAPVILCYDYDLQVEEESDPVNLEAFKTLEKQLGEEK